MNTIRNLFPEDIEELRHLLQTVYRAIYLYQHDRSARLEASMRAAIQSCMPFLERFKPHIPAYKQRYIELLKQPDRMAPYDLIICFDRAIYELHTRLKSGEIANRLPWSKELRDLLNERQEPAPESTEGDDAADTERVDFLTSGVGASRGEAAGVARVILDSVALAKVQPGDILVTPMTDPSFLEVADRIAGLITDRGGLVCHAAILAREFRLPCIVGCRNATQVIPDGEPIMMDTTAGIVTRIAK
ncbi:hypothetical protein GZH47_19570 [Paenibacillus rhizovicinus]|uniref:PEP-utilising enzyme mobile domain-containing protein n=1 Tax=Paenibacillus rhizovicinus TaxID=2704463 RepID=A0A6C0P2R5_9BACL|nr:PEP-utilizing enzyme [Paenibacillus rhizovicinus]QHW32788.1 hypothetical protein GZH47_19570 [Paenibacillus rhizovicinus]